MTAEQAATLEAERQQHLQEDAERPRPAQPRPAPTQAS